MCYEALREVKLSDLRGLIAAADKLPPRFRRLLLNALVERWFELDVKTAREWMISHSSTLPFFGH
jgi:hypothetical protein